MTSSTRQARPARPAVQDAGVARLDLDVQHDMTGRIFGHGEREERAAVSLTGHQITNAVSELARAVQYQPQPSVRNALASGHRREKGI